MSVSKPEKHNPQTNDARVLNRVIGYNLACDDWQAYHTQEIAEVVAVYERWKFIMCSPYYCSSEHSREMWQAIKNLALKARER